MTDAQNSPAPAETERAVEVARGLTKAQRKALPLIFAERGGVFWPIGVARKTAYALRDLGLWDRNGLTPLGRLVARSLKGEG